MKKADAPELGPQRDLLLETSGRVMAMEFVLNLLIESHPNASALSRLWSERVELLIEAGLQSPVYSNNASYRDGMNSALGRMRQLLPG